MIADASVDITFDPALNIARQSLYRFTALSLLDPKAGSWKQLCALRDDTILADAAALIRDLRYAKPDELGLGERPLTDLDPDGVLRRLPISPEDLNHEYENTFGLLVSNACPPYETEYIDSKYTFQRSNALADIRGFYQAFGLTTSNQHPERADHVVLELEFMAFLLALERRAAGQDSRVQSDRLQICRDAQRRFFSDHLAWWLPTFARLLDKENCGGFYAAVGAFLAALVPSERAILNVAIPTTHAQPSVIEQPEQCAGCLLNSDLHS